jgi:ubiquinone/menaquinone biosynthesis C-methylase UbiE
MEKSEYDILAAVEATHWWHSGMRATSAAMLDRLYRTRHDLRILDAGCGTGGTSLFLQRYGQVVGMDIANEAIALHHHQSPLTQASVRSMPFADNSFDLVTSFDVLYHRNVPDEHQALTEIRRVLGPSGRLLLRMPAYEFLRSKHDRAVHTRQRYTASQVRGLLSDAGFLVERWTYVNTLLFPLALAQRVLERTFPSLEQSKSDLSLPSPFINTLLQWPLFLEAAWIHFHGMFPFGLSILCLAHCGKLDIVPTISRNMTSDVTTQKRESDTA